MNNTTPISRTSPAGTIIVGTVLLSETNPFLGSFTGFVCLQGGPSNGSLPHRKERHRNRQLHRTLQHQRRACTGLDTITLFRP
jgi:hypothetical protein